jgi:hypothetical protein
VAAGGTGPYSGQFPAGLVEPDFNKFSPRLGIAYRPGFKRRTVIRSGFSLFYDNTVYNRIPGLLTAQPPFAETSTFTSAADNVLTLEDPFTGPANVTIKNTYAVDKYLRTPYATTWNLSIEHELPGALVSSVTYIGTKGTDLLDGIWPNVLSSGAAGGGSLISNASGFTYYETVGNSIFNALQLRLNRRLRKGLQYTAYYQWAKSIDDATTIGGAGSTLIQNPNDIEADRGLSSFDHRHTFTFNTLATSPFGPRGLYMKRGDTFVSKLLSDYSVTANLTLQTGAPLTATVLGTSADISGTGAVGSTRADATGLPISAGSGPFNLLAFGPVRHRGPRHDSRTRLHRAQRHLRAHHPIWRLRPPQSRHPALGEQHSESREHHVVGYGGQLRQLRIAGLGQCHANSFPGPESEVLIYHAPHHLITLFRLRRGLLGPHHTARPAEGRR